VLPADVRRRRPIDLIRPTGLFRPALGLALVAVIGVGTAVVAAPTSTPATPPLPAVAVARDRTNANVDDSDLQLAATAIVDQAVASGALAAAPATLATEPAAALMTAVYANLEQARVADPGLGPTDTRSLMGPVPFNLSHPLQHLRVRRPRITLTHTLRLFRHAVGVGVSRGLGLNRRHDDVMPARPQRADGVYVDPVLPPVPAHADVAMVALRAAMTRLGEPYVWAAAGPDTFDCSGLVRWAFGKAGLKLLHYTGFQWEEGRHIAATDVLPGDLILFYRSVSHVGIYLGAGWMLNAPYTGQYVNVVPVHGEVAGIVRP
jgi:cell wall-associated NlpC family hydrolase